MSLRTIRNLVAFILLVVFLINGYKVLKLRFMYEFDQYDKIVEVADVEAFVEEEEVEGLSIVVEAYMALDQYDKALEVVDKMLDIEDRLDIRVKKVNILEALGEYDARDLLIEASVDTYKGQYDDLSDLDQFMYWFMVMENGDYEEAIEGYHTFLKKDLEDEMRGISLNNLSYMYLSQEMYDKAIEYGKQSIDCWPSEIMAYLNLGYAYEQSDQYEEAKAIYLKGLELNSEDTDLVYHLAELLELMDDPEALDYWKRYTELEPDNTSAWYGLKNHYYEKGDLIGEVGAQEKITAINDYAYSDVLNLMSLYHDQEAFDKIETIEELFIAHDDNNHIDLLKADYVYEKVSKDQGFDLYKAYFNSHPYEYWDVYDLLSDIIWSEETALFEQFVDMIDAAYGAEIRLEVVIDLYYEYDENKKMIEAAKELLALDGENGYAYEVIGDGYYYADQYGEAIEYYLKAVPLSEETYWIRSSLIDCYIFLDQLSEAKALIETLKIENPEDASLDIYDARILMKSNQVEKALKAYNTAIEKSEYESYALDEYEELAPLKEMIQ